MKITIDTEKQTIKIEGNVKVSELYGYLIGMGLRPDEWEIVGTETNTIYYPYTPAPTYPQIQWIVTSNT